MTTRKKAGLVTFRCAIVMIGTGDRATSIIADAKEKLQEVLGEVPGLMTHLVGAPVLLTTPLSSTRTLSRTRKKKSHGQER